VAFDKEIIEAYLEDIMENDYEKTLIYEKNQKEIAEYLKVVEEEEEVEDEIDALLEENYENEVLIGYED
jgi:hypothetical protein